MPKSTRTESSVANSATAAHKIKWLGWQDSNLAESRSQSPLPYQLGYTPTVLIKFFINHSMVPYHAGSGKCSHIF